MLKISFKDDYKDVVVFQHKVTVVTLTGKLVMELEHIPHHIWTWALEHPSVDVSVTYHDGHECWILKANGKAKCHKDDTPNAKLGEKIAESRAKIRIYRFMHTLTLKLGEYYLNICGIDDVELVSDFVEDNSNILSACKKYMHLLDHERHHLTELLQQTVS